MDGIRQDILDGRNNPTKFPNADAILNLMPQTICNYKMKDKMDRPITLLRINFSLSQFLNEVRHEDFIEFMKYSAEYQKLVLEQLAEEKERKQKMEFENNPHKYENDHYGVLMQACVVRDLSGISYEQLNSQGFGLLKSVIGSYEYIDDINLRLGLHVLVLIIYLCIHYISLYTVPYRTIPFHVNTFDIKL